MTLAGIQEIFEQARDLGTVEWIYFEGGEPFLYYAILLRAARMARERGFKVGIVSNAYWATDEADAREWLAALDGLAGHISLSDDLFHSAEPVSPFARRARTAAEQVGIPSSVIRIAQPESMNAPGAAGDESTLMYRGRAAEKLVERASLRPWHEFRECPYEELREPDRCHVDPLGNVHLCQGISLGNLFETPLARLCETYDPGAHPIVGPLLRGGPAELARHYKTHPEERYADACHLCYRTRSALRSRFPEVLTPAAMYGASEDESD
jgi:MoaA/NifB/PqqE/SkfB family radical SAM enzyme